MKKGFKNLMVAGIVGLASFGLAGCGEKPEDPTTPPEVPASTAYIQVQGFDSGYMQGAQIDLEGAKVLYYESETDTTADEVALTSQMVSNFSTAEAGNKTMKVTHNGCEIQVNYSVITQQQLIQIYNDAIDAVYTADNLRVVTTGVYTYGPLTLNIESFDNISNNKYYGKNNLASIDGRWAQKEGDKWYMYSSYAEGSSKQKSEVTSHIISDKVNYVMLNNNGPKKTDESSVDASTSIDYDIVGDKTIIAMAQNVSGISSTIKITIQNGKLVKLEGNQTSEEQQGSLVMESTYSYNLEDVVMENLPDDADQWPVYEEW